LYTAPEEVHKYRKGNRLEFGGNIRFPEDRTRKGTQKREERVQGRRVLFPNRGI
jgi:hypothetical protein